MKRRAIGAALFIGCIVMSASIAFAVEGLRGSTWGDLRYDIPDEVDDDLILKGWIRQGIDWAHVGKAMLSTYATVRYAWDSRGLDWNNSIGPGVGIALDAWSDKGFAGTLAVEYLVDRYYETDRTEKKVVIYMGWYGMWDLKK
ncbi:MAG: hypothetical protein ABIA59_06795 [Candidatus Latescibacterota bacterium]